MPADRPPSGSISPSGPGPGRKPGHALQLVLTFDRAVEPELVLDDPAAKIAVRVVEMLDRIRVRNILRAQRVGHVVALQLGALAIYVMPSRESFDPDLITATIDTPGTETSASFPDVLIWASSSVILDM